MLTYVPLLTYVSVISHGGCGSNTVELLPWGPTWGRSLCKHQLGLSLSEALGESHAIGDHRTGES